MRMRLAGKAARNRAPTSANLSIGVRQMTTSRGWLSHALDKAPATSSTKICSLANGVIEEMISRPQAEGVPTMRMGAAGMMSATYTAPAHSPR